MITPPSAGRVRTCRSASPAGAEAIVILPMTTASLDVGIVRSANPWFVQLHIRSATLSSRSLQFRTASLVIEFRTRYGKDVASTQSKIGVIDEDNRVVFDKLVLLNITHESVTFRLLCYSRYTGEPVLHGYSHVTAETFLQSRAPSAKVLLVRSTFQGRMPISPPSCFSPVASTSNSTPRTHLCLSRAVKSASTLPPRVYQHFGSADSDDSGDDPFERRLAAGGCFRSRRSCASEAELRDSSSGDEAREPEAKEPDYLSMTCPAKALPNVPKKRFSLASIPRAFKSALRIQKSPKTRRCAEMSESELSHWKCFEVVVNDKEGFESLRSHMEDEKNEENLDFWEHCRQLEEEWNDDAANLLYEEFIKADAPREVNLDCDIRKVLASSLTKESIEAARRQIGSLIERDPFPRFLKTQRFLNLVHAKTAAEVK